LAFSRLTRPIKNYDKMNTRCVQYGGSTKYDGVSELAGMLHYIFSYTAYFTTDVVVRQLSIESIGAPTNDEEFCKVHRACCV
jgi:hypothetical protein